MNSGFCGSGFARERVASPAAEHPRGGLQGFRPLHSGWLQCCDQPAEVHLQGNRQTGQQLVHYRYELKVHFHLYIITCVRLCMTWFIILMNTVTLSI